MMQKCGALPGHVARFDFRFDLVEVQGALVPKPVSVTSLGMALAAELLGFRCVRRR
jgi:hypothetical protein